MINFPETVPPQGERHFWHIVGVGAIGVGGFWAKPKLEREWLKDKVADPTDRKVAAYAITVVGGAVIGGIAKGLRTGTFDGTMAGIVTGAIASFVGALLSEYRSPTP